jgi:hypothetical protein
MSKNPQNRPPLPINLPGASVVAVVASLTTTLQLAIELAVFPERIEVENKSRWARLEALTEKLFREAKSTPTDAISEADETAGMNMTLAIIKDITDRIRNEIRG